MDGVEMQQRAISAGEKIREWRQLRRRSQMEVALDAGISPRHLSFIETGRSNASRETLALLAEELEVPLRERNQLFIAAGFAPAYTELPLDHADLEKRRSVQLCEALAAASSCSSRARKPSACSGRPKK